MEELSNFSNINFRQQRGVVWEGADTMGATFYHRPVHSPAKSAENGAPYYEDRVYVRIHPPGERLNIIDRPATDGDRRRWPVQWSQFLQQKNQRPDGIQISVLYPDRPSIAETLQANGIYTVEQCAELSQEAIQTVGMGCQQWVNAAQRYLDVARRGVSDIQLRRELEERDSKIRTLEHEIQLMREELSRQRPSGGGTITMEQLQQLVAGMQTRPTFPGAVGAPPGQPAPGVPPAFDAATAQINANHPTSEIARRQRGRKTEPPEAA